jgi:hypothetical protein
MVSLLDIVPQKRSVQIAAGELELRGLGLRQIADLLLRFPTLRNLFTQGEPEGITVEALLILAPDAVGAIIAEAAGQPDAAEAIADGFAIDDVAQCLIAVRDLTMPGGVAPFFERLRQLGGSADPGEVPDTILPKRPNGSSLPDTVQAT